MYTGVILCEKFVPVSVDAHLFLIIEMVESDDFVSLTSISILIQRRSLHLEVI
jgi:hypothetical protein